MRKTLLKLLLLCFLSFLLRESILTTAFLNNAEHFITSDSFRAQRISEELFEQLRVSSPQERGILVGNYFVNEKYHLLWKKQNTDYQSYCDAIWKDVTYFPIPDSTTHPSYQVYYEDSWMSERTYGGKRGHEGVDLIASEDQSGLYPVLSMTDGIITQKGWLEKGGWRIGISSPSGGYFYYAHFDSYNTELHVGDEIKAGELLGFMGNSGYGPQGTTGMFATHLHVGIYLYPNGEEVSINPYWILRVAEEKKLSCSF